MDGGTRNIKQIMENEPPFNLEDAIQQWRDSLIQSSRLRQEELEELELHLRDSVIALQKRGLSEDEAWLIAQRRLGKREVLKKEFGKVSSPAKVLTSSWERLIAAMQIPTPPATEILRRIMLMERDIVLPAKVIAIGILLFSFYSSPWFTNVSSELELGVEAVQDLLWGYIGMNALAAGVLVMGRRMPLGFLQWMVFGMTLLDGVFILSIMTLVGGVESMYWLFPILFVRAAFSVPRLSSQILLTLTLIACYAFACAVQNGLARNLGAVTTTLFTERQGQSIVLPLVLLISIAACCFGTQFLLRRNQPHSTPVAD
jgi:hypothetical protein